MSEVALKIAISVIVYKQSWLIGKLGTKRNDVQPSSGLDWLMTCGFVDMRYIHFIMCILTH